ncbi:hypothetical protein [Streptomyces hawaiiensis]|uniref:hypothetical protein n=1 Tax=Streptomyces hawaiiensis TaxID=67305 RepID=UPI0015869F5F|nr:hypothetical protein [Streptomyces hawaiiensis]
MNAPHCPAPDGRTRSALPGSGSRAGIIGLYLLAPIVKRELGSFLEFVRARKAGEISDDDEDQGSVKTTL